jgi:hypothetical protein
VLASFLINTWEGVVLRAEKNSTPLEEFEEVVFEKLLTLPTLGGMNHEHLQ